MGLSEVEETSYEEANKTVKKGKKIGLLFALGTATVALLRILSSKKEG